MYEPLVMLWHLVLGADTLVWAVAVLLAVVAAVIFHAHTDDALFSVAIGVALLASIVLAHVAFTVLGILFLSDRTANVVAAAGAALCSVTAITVIALRILYAIGERTNRLKGET